VFFHINSSSLNARIDKVKVRIVSNFFLILNKTPDYRIIIISKIFCKIISYSVCKKQCFFK
jgi:hypothetical protein